MNCPQCGTPQTPGTTTCPQCGCSFYPGSYQPPAETSRPLKYGFKEVFARENRKALLKCSLISIVPIVNFFTLGALSNWGAELVNGTARALPREVCTDQNFKAGARAFLYIIVNFILFLIVPLLLISLLFFSEESPALYFLGEILIRFLAFVGSGVILVLSTIGAIRASSSNHTSDGLRYPSIFASIKRRPGDFFKGNLAVFGVNFAGNFVVNLIIVMISLVFVGLFMGRIAIGHNGEMASSVIFLVLSIVGILVVFLIYALLSMIFSTFVWALSCRVNGWWIAENVPEWSYVQSNKGPLY